ncbi:MAG TPA: thioredoxin family protein [Candidatus Doudnabacteria bacterium]|nr:thioredoxin family protein [Candidatus Doudnabacteria bacterium]
MNQKNYIWAIIIVAILLVGGFLMYNNRPNSEVATDQTVTQPTETENMMEGGAMMGPAENEVMSESPGSQQAVQKSGSYQNYSSATLQSEHAAGNKVVLFFHAPWCPFCREADSAFSSNEDKIPSGVTVLKIDYDSNSELRKKYGITTQHSFVQINPDSELVTKWIGGDIDNLIKFVK